MEQVTDKADRREMQIAALKYDLSTGRPLKELVLGEIRNGTAPAWIVVKYGHLGVTLERVLAAKAAIDKQKEEQRERDQSMRGNREAPEIGQGDHGSGSV